MRIIGNDPNKPRQTAATASGTLPNGKPVVVNSDGTVSVVSETSVSAQTTTPTTFTTNTIQNFLDATYDSGNDRVVVVYSDGSNSSYGTAVVGTVSSSDNSITFGTPVVFDSLTARDTVVAYDANAGKVVVAYYGFSSPNTGLAIVGTVSGSSISFGSRVTMNATGPSGGIGIVYAPDQQKIVCSYRDQYNSNYGTAIVGTVSGTSISFGTEVVFNSGTTYQNVLGYDTTKNRVLCAYRDNSNSNYGTIIAGTISGTSITFGSESVFQSAATYPKEVVHDSTNNKNVIFFGGNSEHGKAIVATLDESDDSFTFGSVVTFKSASIGSSGGGAFNAAAGKIDFIYKDESDNNKAKFVTGTVSGTSISFTSETTVDTNQTDFFSVVYNTTLKNNFIAYSDETNTQGEAFVNQLAYTETNLTAENYIGMSQGPVQVFAEGAGSLVEYHSTDTRGNNIAYDAASGKFVAIFNPGPPTSSPPAGYAIVGTVDPSDNSITYGTAVQFESGEVYGDYMGITYDSNAEKVVIAYMDVGDSNNSKAIVGTVSGTSISFGTPTTFNGQTQFVTCAFDSTNNKVVIVYKDNSNSDYGTAIVGTVSGTSISFGTKAVFNSGNTSHVNLCFDSTNDKIIIGYRDQAASQQATCVVGTVSGTSISFGSEVTVSPNSATDTVPIYDPVAEKVVFVYTDSSDSDKGKVKIGTVSGTSISFGDAVTFDATNYESGAGVFDTNAGKVTIAYKGASGYPYIISGTVSGSTMTFGDAVQLGSFAAAGFRFGCAYDSATYRIVSVFIDSDATPDTGESAVFNNFYEIRPSIADGGNALMDTQGGISDNQSSLTAGQSYYVLNDGTISTTAGDPSVFAGTAVSSTKLIVKG